MRFRRALCVFNPVAGAGDGGKRIREVREQLSKAAGEVRLAPTEGPHHAAELACRAAADGFDLLAVQGGDGTVNEALQGLAGKEVPALAVLAAGTANVFAREVGLPPHPVRAASQVPQLVRRRVALGLVDFAGGGSRYFLSMCGAGLDAAIASRTGSPLKNRLGVAAFWLSGTAQVFLPFPRLRVAGNGRPRAPCSLVVVSKSRAYGGGLVFTPGANLLANRFEVARFRGTSRFFYCGYLFAGICAATRWWPGIEHSACERLCVEPAGRLPVPLQVDGEVAGLLPATVALSSQSVSLLLPPSYCSEHGGPANGERRGTAGDRRHVSPDGPRKESDSARSSTGS